MMTVIASDNRHDAFLVDKLIRLDFVTREEV